MQLGLLHNRGTALRACADPLRESLQIVILRACRGGPHSSLMFCTNGVLLRMLTQGEGMKVRSHGRELLCGDRLINVCTRSMSLRKVLFCRC